MVTTIETYDFRPLATAAKALGVHPRTARRRAKADGCIRDERGETVLSMPVKKVAPPDAFFGGALETAPADGADIRYVVSMSDLFQMRQLVVLDEPAPAELDKQGRKDHRFAQSLGTTVYTDGEWTAVGEVESILRLAEERPELLTAIRVAPNRAVLRSEHVEELREALDELHAEMRAALGSSWK
jgi:hypothetical protein